MAKRTSDTCPHTGQHYLECDVNTNDVGHIEWHLNKMVEDGDAVKWADGTYSLIDSN